MGGNYEDFKLHFGQFHFWEANGVWNGMEWIKRKERSWRLNYELWFLEKHRTGEWHVKPLDVYNYSPRIVVGRRRYKSAYESSSFSLSTTRHNIGRPHIAATRKKSETIISVDGGAKDSRECIFARAMKKLCCDDLLSREWVITSKKNAV